VVPARRGHHRRDDGRLIQRKRATVAAVTDGRVIDRDGLVEAVVRELRDGRPFAHLRAVV
jgi:SWI/SNF-related matrix-associated actin-dependent regulator of chromatin subfamily A-like protein 1